MREIVKFETNVPLRLALAYDEGKDVAGRFGDQVMYTLEDEQVMYVDPIIRTKLNALGIRRKEPFVICKTEKRAGQRRTIEWEVRRPEPEAAPTPVVTAPVSQHGEAEASTRRSQGNGTTPPAPPVNGAAKPNGLAGGPPHAEPMYDPMALAGATMLSALCAAVDAAQATETYAAEKGYLVRFSGEDIRAVGLTLYINFAKGGK